METGARGAGPPLPPDATTARRAAIAVVAAVAAATLARAAAAFLPGTWAWSLDLNRHLAALPGWGLWAASALALAPPLARRAGAALERAGDAIVAAPRRWMALGAALAALLVILLPDRARFVGDALLRQDTLETPGLDIAAWYPQALPLDLGLHHEAARRLMLALNWSASAVSRAFGAVEAGILAALAIAFARGLRLGGAAAAVAAALGFWTGALTLFTGYNKAFAEMALVVAAVAAAAVRVAGGRGGFAALGLATAAGLALHRSALGLLPAVALAWGFALRERGAGLLRRPGAWVGLGAPLVALAVLAPRILTILRTIDPVHFAPGGAEPGGALAAAFAGARPVDVANLLLMLAPAALVVPAAAVGLGRAAWRRETLVLGALALPFLTTIPFIHAQQGLFRDWDDFAAGGVALSLLAAWLAARVLEARPSPAWLALPLIAGAALPSLQWMAHQGDRDRALDRARAFAEQPPARTPFERAMTWQYLGRSHLGREGLRAADAYAEAARLLPSPHLLRQWGAAEAAAGRLDQARSVWRTLLSRKPDDVFAWNQLLEVEVMRQDTAAVRAAAESLLAHAPGDERARRVIAVLDGPRPPGTPAAERATRTPPR